MKLKDLFEGQEKSLVGMTIQGKTDFAGKKWEGNFICDDKKLTSLEGAPSSISGNFSCYFNQLTSLEDAPSSVSDNFSCYYNQLTSLKGAPSSVGNHFLCHNNQLTSLEGAPSKVGGDFYCNNNKLTSLCNIHKQIKVIGGNFNGTKNPIKSHVLGLLKIKKLQKVYLDNKEVQNIINKYLPEGDLFVCQQELIDAGYEEYAQL